ncbi:MAG TPA: DUF4034 domain-containing protein, partial [Gammaproteobacteria bacterium]|nr:DUF4034 domain-containing protein [Gammaproteobacteria bacterium]
MSSLRRFALILFPLFITLAIDGAHAQDGESASAAPQPSTAFPAPSVTAPPAELWLPRALTPQEKPRHVAADVLLMQAERLREGYPNTQFLQDELRQHKYDLVESQLDVILAKSMADPAYEFVEQDAANFAEGENPVQPLDKTVIDDWVAAIPDSPWAHYSEGLRWSDKAWDARGNGWAQDITEAQWKVVHADETQARAEIRKSLTLNPKIAIAWVTLMNIDRTDGTMDDETKDFVGGSKQRPASFLIPDQFEEQLQPRWGGSMEIMDALAQAEVKKVDLNPRFWSLLGSAAADAGCAACNHYDWATSLKEYNSALIYGDRPSWLERAGDAAKYLHRYALAHAYYERAKHYKTDEFDLVIETDLMDALCNPATDPRKLAILEQ